MNADGAPGPGTDPAGGQAGPAGGHAASRPPQGPADGIDLEHLASLVSEHLSGQPGHHSPGPSADVPSVADAIALRDQAPELYDLWLRIAQERAQTTNYVQRAPYEVPERLAQNGRPRALSALGLVLAFCGYLAWLGGPGPYLAGLIALVDLVIMLGIFFGLRPEHLSDRRRDPRL